VCRGVPQTPTGFTVRPQGVRWIAPKERQRGTAFPAARSCDWWPTNGTAWLRVAQGFTGKGKGLAFGRAGLYGGETRTVLRGGRHKVGDGEAGLAFGRHGGTRACVCVSACVLGHSGSQEGGRARVCARLATAEQIEGLGAAARVVGAG
jgi:hypothetical protein